VEIKVDGQKFHVKGPKGELERILPDVLIVRVEDGAVVIGLKQGVDASKENSKFWGLGRALAATVIKGVSDGFEKALEFNGVGFKAQVKDDKGVPLIETPPAQVITITPPASQVVLTSQAKGSITSSLTWLAAFWLRVIKKAIHFGWKIIGKQND